MAETGQKPDLYAERRAKLDALRAAGFNYPNDFRPDATAVEILGTYRNLDAAALAERKVCVRVGGRMMTRRVMGKASFAHLDDGSGRIQIFLRRDALGEEPYVRFKSLDLGDIVGVQGMLFRTRTGELSVRVEKIDLIAKCLRPLPEKFHGLKDAELRHRRRYLDLMMNPEIREIFRKRAEILRICRALLDARGYLEVETPMMQPLAGGAAARPFVTHHNALNISLYLRIAPELYLKRLLVGGFQRVYELNRSFRNEGTSTRHNPEFTMLEAYQAYGNCASMMILTEDLLRLLALDVLGTAVVRQGGAEIDLGVPFRRVALGAAVLAACPDLRPENLREVAVLRAAMTARRIESLAGDAGWGKHLLALFEALVEPGLMQPTFVTDYPREVSPLARAHDDDPERVDRFELFIGGREIANGFSELNDPLDQAQRFEEQARERRAGDVEAMVYDRDYVRALEYGMPAAGGVGIGIDRVVMLFAGIESIREVLLFPLLRPEPSID